MYNPMLRSVYLAQEPDEKYLEFLAIIKEVQVSKGKSSEENWSQFPRALGDFIDSRMIQWDREFKDQDILMNWQLLKKSGFQQTVYDRYPDLEELVATALQDYLTNQILN